MSGFLVKSKTSCTHVIFVDVILKPTWGSSSRPGKVFVQVLVSRSKYVTILILICVNASDGAKAPSGVILSLYQLAFYVGDTRRISCISYLDFVIFYSFLAKICPPFVQNISRKST